MTGTALKCRIPGGSDPCLTPGDRRREGGYRRTSSICLFDIRPFGELALHGEELPEPWNTFQLMVSAVVERDAGPGDEGRY